MGERIYEQGSDFDDKHHVESYNGSECESHNGSECESNGGSECESIGGSDRGANCVTDGVGGGEDFFNSYVDLYA